MLSLNSRENIRCALDDHSSLNFTTIKFRRTSPGMPPDMPATLMMAKWEPTYVRGNPNSAVLPSYC